MKGLLLTLVSAGGLCFLWAVLYWGDGIMPIVPGLFKESISVPIKLSSLGGELFAVEMDNFLVFQQFESLSPSRFPLVGKVYGAIVWLLFVIGLSLISTLKRNYFIAAAGATMLLFAFGGVNGLNIGAISSNYGLIGLLAGTLLPTVVLAFYAVNWGIWRRFGLLLATSAITLFTLIKLSPISDPVLWLAENASFIAAIGGGLFLLHIGHVFVAGTSIFLIRLNKGTGIKISWHILLVAFLYFLLVLFTLLSQMGSINLPFPTVIPGLLMLFCGVIGYWVIKLKIEQSPQAYGLPAIGEAFYWTGFALVLWTWAYAQFNGNQPLYELLTHLFLYSQIVLSVLFTLYLFANFSDVLNSGKDVEKILFKPKFFAYFHMRIGAIMGLVVMVIFAEAVVGVQLSTANTNIAADYYYQVEKPLEAAILYENSWELYRKNDKAKNAAAHLRFGLNQSSMGMENLTQSFDFVPNVPNILLLASKLFQQEKLPAAMFYLQEGLKFFPNNPHLLNNLALLQSRAGKADDAISLLENMESRNVTAEANLLALRAKHGKLDQIPEKPSKDLVTQVNYLATQNLQGNLSDIDLNTQSLPDNLILKNSLLRNQWSNHASGGLETDLALVDSLIAQPQMSFEELEYRETRVIRSLAENHINESLKYLNGISQQFPQSAGYYHGIAGNILISQLDFEKASVDLELAFQKGYQTFQPQHLAVIYFAGKEALAFAIKEKFGIPFPEWMQWDASGQVVENEKVKYFDILSKLLRQMPEDFLVGIEKIENPSLKAELAGLILLHKMHWLSEADFRKVKSFIISAQNATWTESDLDAWYAFVKDENEESPSEKINNAFRPDLGLERNAYWTPLVMKKISQEPDELRKYEILQDAIQFNKDPKLWIMYVNQSRKIGMDNYGSSVLVEMQGWLTISQIERLQMENL
jgi:hypothetical protein